MRYQLHSSLFFILITVHAFAEPSLVLRPQDGSGKTVQAEAIVYPTPTPSSTRIPDSPELLKAEKIRRSQEEYIETGLRQIAQENTSAGASLTTDVLDERSLPREVRIRLHQARIQKIIDENKKRQEADIARNRQQAWSPTEELRKRSRLRAEGSERTAPSDADRVAHYTKLFKSILADQTSSTEVHILSRRLLQVAAEFYLETSSTEGHGNTDSDYEHTFTREERIKAHQARIEAIVAANKLKAREKAAASAAAKWRRLSEEEEINQAKMKAALQIDIKSATSTLTKALGVGFETPILSPVERERFRRSGKGTTESLDTIMADVGTSEVMAALSKLSDYQLRARGKAAESTVTLTEHGKSAAEIMNSIVRENPDWVWYQPDLRIPSYELWDRESLARKANRKKDSLTSRPAVAAKPAPAMP